MLATVLARASTVEHGKTNDVRHPSTGLLQTRIIVAKIGKMHNSEFWPWSCLLAVDLRPRHRRNREEESAGARSRVVHVNRRLHAGSVRDHESLVAGNLLMAQKRSNSDTLFNERWIAFSAILPHAIPVSTS